MKEFSKNRATLILMIAAIGSNVLGLGKDIVFNLHFKSDLLKIYFSAFRFPDLIYNLVVLGVLSSIFITFFIDHLNNKGKEDAFKFANNIINFTIIATSIFSIILFFMVPFLIHGLTPGFSPEEKELTAKLIQIMLLQPILMGLSSVIGGVLNSFKKFVAYALAPIFYNLGIIFGAIFLAPKYGIFGLAYGVLIGAFLHLLIQLVPVLKTGYRYKFVFNATDQSLRQMLKLAPPRIGGLLASQANLFIITIVGSLIGGGSITYLMYANDIQAFVVVVFGLSFATVVFPLLADYASLNKTEEFINELSTSFRQILFFAIPASLGLILLRGQIVRLLLGYGFFKFTDTKLTAAILGVFALSLFAQASILILVRAFYALKDTKTPFYAALSAVLVNIIGSITLPKFFDQYVADPKNGITFAVVGLAAAFTIASFVNMLILLIALHKRLGGLNDGKIINSLSKIIIASAAMAISIQGLKYVISPIINPIHPVLGFTVQTLFVIFAGAGVYFFLAYILGCDEIKGFKNIFKRTPSYLQSDSDESKN
ncbi:murein biosynthesis integral membrane protein MurJ [bacterium CG06_land_8_20_14_3_00_33_50]|nr:MAG: murein biosynthesis integral membrane protein MurJ [bacterium CG10_big_fil_rev_8_21_14_0_10_33_18]PIU76616.1 MAG: murein biosynthesis integral membrane protein MurJ [bacterium CG06_land_8_20_14_3_00_33_50]PJA72666.1 MAG: murein biosynthesis integral membrane protein MurJ [bacterium CG_4_9_14_3_um_filter_33_26]